jgi:hypothetical protein
LQPEPQAEVSPQLVQLLLLEQVQLLELELEQQLPERLDHHPLLRAVWQLPKALLVGRPSVRKFRRQLDQYR